MVTLTLCGLKEANMARTPTLLCQRLQVRFARLYPCNNETNHYYAVLRLLRIPCIKMHRLTANMLTWADLQPKACNLCTSRLQNDPTASSRTHILHRVAAGRETQTMTRKVQLVSAGSKGGVAGIATVLASRKYHGKELAQGLVQVVNITITSDQHANQILVQADDKNAEPEIVAGITTLADVPPGYVAVICSANTQAVQQDTAGTAKGGVQPAAGQCAAEKWLCCPGASGNVLVPAPLDATHCTLHPGQSEPWAYLAGHQLLDHSILCMLIVLHRWWDAPLPGHTCHNCCSRRCCFAAQPLLACVITQH